MRERETPPLQETLRRQKRQQLNAENAEDFAEDAEKKYRRPPESSITRLLNYQITKFL